MLRCADECGSLFWATKEDKQSTKNLFCNLAEAQIQIYMCSIYYSTVSIQILGFSLGFMDYYKLNRGE